MKQVMLIIVLCVFFSILFGVLHNQMSARVSPEYFTIGHRALIHSTSPTLMGIAWGIWSTWWVGLVLGVLLSAAGRMGKWEKRSALSLLKPVSFLFCICGASSLAFGYTGYRLSVSGTIPFLEQMGSAIRPEDQPRFIAALWMHTASYTAAAMGGLILSVHVFMQRIHAQGEGTVSARRSASPGK